MHGPPARPVNLFLDPVRRERRHRVSSNPRRPEIAISEEDDDGSVVKGSVLDGSIDDDDGLLDQTIRDLLENLVQKVWNEMKLETNH